MNLRPNRLAATLAATGVTAALVLASPMGADAAKMITGKDIKNNSITSKDVRDGSLTTEDFAAGQGPTAGLVGPAGPAGPAGKDGVDGKPAPQPTTVAFTGRVTAANPSAISTDKIPANSQVTGLKFETTNADFSGCNGFGQVSALVNNNSFYSAPLLSGGPVNPQYQTIGVGPTATAVRVTADCYNFGSGTAAPPVFDYKVTLTYTTFDPTPSATFTSTPVPAA